MKHLEIKKKLLEEEQTTGRIQKYNRLKKKHSLAFNELIKTGQTDKLESVERVLSTFTEEEQKACYQLNDAKKKKYQRIYGTIQALTLLFNELYFVTLTFAPEYYESKDTTKQDHVKRCLFKHSPVYIANIDYGGLNGRLHYHAITTEPITSDMWPYGFIDCKKIGKEIRDRKKVAKYVAKFSNHALKSTNKTKKVLYSRALSKLIQVS